MKRKQRVSYLGRAATLMALAALFLPIWSAWVYAQSGGGYNLTWNTMDSGGGGNSGGGYILNGTIGQPEAGLLGGGAYVLVGGFWESEQVPVGVIVGPSLGGLLIITDTQGLTTTVQIPPGAVTSTTMLTITPISMLAETIPPGLGFAGHAFDLDAYRDGQLLTGFKFETTVTVTIYYSDADVRGLDEKSVKLYRWVPPTWEYVGVRPGEGQTPPDTVNHVLTAWLRGLTKFGEMGVTQNYIYLPIIIRNQ